ncbi:MAG TPA: universal stress protein [Gaiellaceae bacterium]|nr:universal stress protein [Gaiellaceae bacterium]
MNRIVLGYDASPAADRALERTIALATALRAPVVVASVAPVLEVVARGVRAHYDPADPPALHEERSKDAVAKLSEHGVRARAVTTLGHTAESLVELADSMEADLIVVGMSSRDVVSQILGGVSDDVAHNAHCDVLLVH